MPSTLAWKSIQTSLLSLVPPGKLCPTPRLRTTTSASTTSPGLTAGFATLAGTKRRPPGEHDRRDVEAAGGLEELRGLLDHVDVAAQVRERRVRGGEEVALDHALRVGGRVVGVGHERHVAVLAALGRRRVIEAARVAHRHAAVVVGVVLVLRADVVPARELDGRLGLVADRAVGGLPEVGGGQAVDVGLGLESQEHVVRLAHGGVLAVLARVLLAPAHLVVGVAERALRVHRVADDAGDARPRVLRLEVERLGGDEGKVGGRVLREEQRRVVTARAPAGVGLGEARCGGPRRSRGRSRWSWRRGGGRCASTPAVICRWHVPQRDTSRRSLAVSDEVASAARRAAREEVAPRRVGGRRGGRLEDRDVAGVDPLPAPERRGEAGGGGERPAEHHPPRGVAPEAPVEDVEDEHRDARRRRGPHQSSARADPTGSSEQVRPGADRGEGGHQDERPREGDERLATRLRDRVRDRERRAGRGRGGPRRARGRRRRPAAEGLPPGVPTGRAPVAPTSTVPRQRGTGRPGAARRSGSSGGRWETERAWEVVGRGSSAGRGWRGPRDGEAPGARPGVRRGPAFCNGVDAPAFRIRLPGPDPVRATGRGILPNFAPRTSVRDGRPRLVLHRQRRLRRRAAVDRRGRAAEARAGHHHARRARRSASATGGEVLNFCANNYLGLANHPRLIAAAQGGARHARLRHGLGALHLRHAGHPQGAREGARRVPRHGRHDPLHLVLRRERRPLRDAARRERRDRLRRAQPRVDHRRHPPLQGRSASATSTST